MLSKPFTAHWGGGDSPNDYPPGVASSEGEGLPSLGDDFPTSCPEACLLGDSRAHQVEDQEEHSKALYICLPGRQAQRHVSTEVWRPMAAVFPVW